MAEGGKTIYIGGQNGILSDGTMAGNTLTAQTEQAYKNILEILKTVGASQENVVKQTISVVKGKDIREGYASTQKVRGNSPRLLALPSLAILAFLEH